MSFFAELRRRNVIRMAGLYVVGAWLIIQVAETLLPAFDIPAWVLRATIILLAIGFLPALIVSWVFEWTPDGLKRESADVSSSERPSEAGRRMDRLILIGALLVIAVLVAERWLLPLSSTEPPVESTLAVDGAEEAREPSDTGQVGAADSQKVSAGSIAVLPFVNMSPDADNEYFADGISEELLNVLAGVEGLTVSSRTSAFSFKGKDTAVPEIARQLGVAHVLEGSVRKQGQQVRITAQLIRAAGDKHLWSQTYDRELVDIFKVQEEIAQSISNELTGLLGANTVKVKSSTDDTEAYELFLHSRTRFFERRDLAEAVADLQAAVALDPQFGEAWLYLAACYLVIPDYVPTLDRTETYQNFLRALAQAEALLPDHALTLAMRGQTLQREGRTAEGLKLQERAVAIRSGDSTPLLWYGLNLLFAGYSDEARVALESAKLIDPLSPVNNGWLGAAYLNLGRRSEGAASIELAVSRGGYGAVRVQEVDWASRGQFDKIAQFISSRSREGEDTEFDRRYLQALRDPAKRPAFERELVQSQRFELLLVFGNADAFLDQFVQLINTRDSTFAALGMRSLWLPNLVHVREDPRFFQAADKYGMVDLWESRGYPPGCTRVTDPAGDHLQCEDPRS